MTASAIRAHHRHFSQMICLHVAIHPVPRLAFRPFSSGLRGRGITADGGTLEALAERDSTVVGFAVGVDCCGDDLDSDGDAS
jgi:hypothetical protein